MKCDSTHPLLHHLSYHVDKVGGEGDEDEDEVEGSGGGVVSCLRGFSKDRADDRLGTGDGNEDERQNEWSREGGGADL